MSSLQELKDKLQKRFGARCPAGALARANAQLREGMGKAWHPGENLKMLKSQWILIDV